MDVTEIVYGTVTLEPGASITRIFDCPAGQTGAPSQYFSKVNVADLANFALFSWVAIESVEADPAHAFMGASQFELIYTITGTSAVDVDFVFVWTEGEPSAVYYAGS